MNFTVTILGSGAAIPTFDRNPTAHLVEVRNRLMLLDCAEGTQMQLRKSGYRFQKVSHIFISHLHGDHYFGLIGLLNTLHLLGRSQPLHLYGIQPLIQLINLQLELSRTTLAYPLVFHPFETENPSIILDDGEIAVSTIPLNHRVPTCGFLIREKAEKRKILKDFLRNVKVPFEFFEKIKDGEDYTDSEGKVYPNHLITNDPPLARSYAYCTDTAYHEPVIPLIKNCDLLYHEATFMEDKAKDAHAKFHSTAREAATIALKAGVKKLVIGHFSARYKEVDSLLEEARQVFPDTVLGQDGMTIQV
ncbi:MAG: ribonuclease Z [Bacteroidales bacterium]|nr:ribonuclease Z [Bacteroidales bacterium]